MKTRLSLLAGIAAVMALALAGFLNGATPAKALIPDPIQPFDPNEVGGISSTALGSAINNYTYTDIIKGERVALPWIFSPPGFSLIPDKEIVDNSNVGTVTSEIDAGCDGIVDTLVLSCADQEPYDWKEATTAVEGTSDAFLLTVMPPFSFVVRHRADITNICIDGHDIGVPNVLNTVYANVPWSPNSSAFVANTKLGGNPVFPTTSSGVCLDSPQSSRSVTTVYLSPTPETDSDRPCDPALNLCVDASIAGMWTQNSVSVPEGGSVTIPVTKIKVNNSPMPGNFMELWETEVTNPNIIAEWMPAGSSVVNQPVMLPPGVIMPQGMDLSISCVSPGPGVPAGEGLVVLKNILWPVNQMVAMPVPPWIPGPPTKDTYADDNAFTFVVKVMCDDFEGTPLVDKEVIWIKPVSVVPPTVPPSTPKHLQLHLGEMAIVTIDELKANHHTDIVPGQEWLVAEVSDVDGFEGPDIAVSWAPFINTEPPVPHSPVVDCSTSMYNQCITYTVDEPHGQVDVLADLGVMCPPTTRPGLYSVVIKGIDAPLPPYGEKKASDNASRSVIKVWCGVSEPEAGTPDGRDDAAGYYPRWTIFQSQPAAVWPSDSRASFVVPPAFPSDVGYVERKVDLQCFWMDADGTPPGADGIVTPAESMGDVNRPAGSDDDEDCLQDWGPGEVTPPLRGAQPSHPIDLDDEPDDNELCDYDPSTPESDPLPYSQEPNLVQYNTAADMDCDGLVDGIERAWGSNPLLKDSDADGADDFVEMFQFTNPLNPDTDDDGISDRPEDDYLAAAAGGAEGAEAADYDDNCPGIYNPDQANNDGGRRYNGTQIGGGGPTDWASNPVSDKTGDVCDADDDNDGVVDVAELARQDPPGIPDPTQTTNNDSDGDACIDGIEGYLGADPTNPASKCPAALNLSQIKFTRACRWNLPPDGYDGGIWDAEYDALPAAGGANDDVEWDPDGDGVICGVTGGVNPIDPDNDNGDGVPNPEIGAQCANAVDDDSDTRANDGCPAVGPPETGTQCTNTLDDDSPPDGKVNDGCPALGDKDEYPDNVEIKGYGSAPANRDTDGDKCEDWIEITDVNGDRSANISDVLLIARRAFNLLPPSDSDPVFDINKDGSLNLSDPVSAARNSSLVKSHGLCKSDTVVD